MLDALRPGSYFINTARAEVVDQAALYEAVRDRGIRAGLDVFAGEPSGGTGTVDDRIFELDGVIGTHHIGASTEQAQQAIADETVRIIREYAQTGRVPNVVNLGEEESRDPPAGRASLRPRRRALGGLQPAQARGHQRPGDGEHRFRGGGRRRRPHPPRPGPAAAGPGRHAGGFAGHYRVERVEAVVCERGRVLVSHGDTMLEWKHVACPR